MEIQILAQEPRILVGGRPVETGPPKQSLILVVLALSAGKVVPTRVLIDRVWGDAVPESVRASVYANATGIRRILRETGDAARLVSRSRGYVLDVDPGVIDLNRARKLYEDGGRLLRRGEHRAAADLLGQALDLWTGEPLAGFDGEWAERTRAWIEAQRLRLLIRWAEARGELGEFDETAERLADACLAHPGDDPLAYTRMRVLAGAGRQSEAVECYEELRTYLREARGTDPNPRTREFFQRMLADDGSGEGRGGEGYRSVPAPPEPLYPPSSLGPDLSDFVTREAEVASLLDGLRADGGAVVQVIEGTAGAGKSVLARHVAHILSADHELVVELSLQGSEGRFEPAHALHRLLRLAGVHHGVIPAETEARAALWRSRAARQRTLVVLDDAVPGQVGPLLPGTPGSTVLVTSRRALTDLDGARRLTLGPLGPDDSTRMLSAFTGLSADTPGFSRLVSRLDGLPLELRLVANQLRSRTAWTPDYFADRIDRRGIDEVAAGGRSLAAAFDISFRDLSPPTRRVFLTLGLHPTTTVPLHALAAAVGDWEQAERGVGELLANHMLVEPSTGAVLMHDRVRDFARQYAQETMPPEERRAAGHRYLDHYLAAVDAADRITLPGRPGRLDVRTTHASRLPEFEDARSARRWFADVYPAVEAAVDYAREYGFMSHVARIPLAMAGLLDTDGPWDRAEALHAGSVEAWRWLDRGHGLGRTLYELGRARWRLRDLDGAERSLRAAVSEAGQRGDPCGWALAKDQLGVIRYESGRDEEALEEYHRAYGEFRRTGEHSGVAMVFNHIGVSQNVLGRYDIARAAFTTSIALYQMHGDGHSVAKARMNCSEVLFRLGYHRESKAMCEQALTLFREFGDDRSTAQALHDLGIVAGYRNRHEEAVALFTEARSLFQAVGDEVHTIDTEAYLGSSLLELGRTEEARELLEPCLGRIRSRNAPVVESQLLTVLGDFHTATGRLSEGQRCYRAAAERARNGSSRLKEGLAYDRLGDLCNREGRAPEAAQHWGKAVQILEYTQIPHLRSIRLKLAINGQGGIVDIESLWMF
ncbi:AfsR/SARP family transcriptional regulator [Nocardiopsis tropica]|uniref:Tetratricopeptide repeat protein n=1 Tax=Nocardiopsis tropica TaxID=109330 RepID=A0ABU7KIM0_9ACTN|nr:tetratricopeptide repeat protein [Nocardiopsis umidischolae]MEE2049146.1 tetratricopeptide repeat protein [Nocardiopsis umidischolae]